MPEHTFKLNNTQLQEIAHTLHKKVLEGLKKQDTEIRCIPTYIEPQLSDIRGKALVLDLGGTNLRAAVVKFSHDKDSIIYPENGWQKNLSVLTTKGYSQQQLFKEIAELIFEVNENALPIGYCFSYPAESMLNGDARLIRWTKEVNIPEMIGKPVGQTLLDYLNSINRNYYTSVKVINDTVSTLFAGVTHSGYDAYIGLIAGTGVNMATFIPSENIPKLNSNYDAKNLIPVNLESGNFFPPYLTDIDDTVDAYSIDKGQQRFEKATSGAYLGKILQTVFPDTDFGENFDTRQLVYMMNHPAEYKDIHVETARDIYTRSAILVAASLKGLIDVLLEFDPDIKRICLIAEGSLFWSKDTNGVNYEALCYTKLHELLKESGFGYIAVDIKYKQNANLIGSAIAALS